MTYYDKYIKYKKKYNNLKILNGGLENLSLYNIIFSDKSELKELKIPFAHLMKNNIKDVIKDIFNLYLKSCSENSNTRGISLRNIFVDIISDTKKLHFYLNLKDKILCDKVDDMRDYFKNNINYKLKEFNNMFDYINKCLVDTKLNEENYVKTLLFMMNKIKKDSSIESNINKIIKDNTKIKDFKIYIYDNILKIKNMALDIILRTNYEFLSPEALAYLFDVKGILNFDDFENKDILKFRNLLIKDYEKYYDKYFSPEYNIITIDKQIEEYRKIIPGGETMLATEQRNLLNNLYSPPEEIGKLKDYMIKIDIYAIGLIFMTIVKFIEEFTKQKIDDKYKQLITVMTLYDVRFRYDVYKCKDIIDNL